MQKVPTELSVPLSEKIFVLKGNWFTRPPNHDAASWMAGMGLLLYVASFLFFTGGYGSTDWMPASGASVFEHHQYWRLWTTLFAHGDFGHLLNNSLLFLPFAYLLTGYFGVFVFPFLGILVGGGINYFVLKTMPLNVSLIGISGVVYWMGATYITLHCLVDRRRSLRYRLAGSIFVTLVLFVPDTYQAQVSYMSHFLGYVLGVLSAVVYYYLCRSKFVAAEIWEEVFDESLLWDPEVVSQNETDDDALAMSNPQTLV